MKMLLDDKKNSLANHDDTTRTLGKKIYEFSGHTGNVHLTTTDRTVAVDDGTGTIYTYLPDVNSTADFYPFGLQKPGRNTGMDSYRYAFQGMEYDAEKTGTEGGSYTTEFRQYDPRLGRWLSLDPLMARFPHMSAYVGYSNNPILYVDPHGLAATNGDGGPPKENGKTDGETYEDESGQNWVWFEGAGWGATTNTEGGIEVTGPKFAGEDAIANHIINNGYSGLSSDHLLESYVVQTVELSALKKAVSLSEEVANKARFRIAKRGVSSVVGSAAADAAISIIDVASAVPGVKPDDLDPISLAVSGMDIYVAQAIHNQGVRPSWRGNVLIAIVWGAFQYCIDNHFEFMENEQAMWERQQLISGGWDVIGDIVDLQRINRREGGNTLMGAGSSEPLFFIYSDTEVATYVTLHGVAPTMVYFSTPEEAERVLGFRPTHVYVGFKESISISADGKVTFNFFRIVEMK